MNSLDLTLLAGATTSLPMQDSVTLSGRASRISVISIARRAAVLVGGTMVMVGCVSVSAPDKPIVIELNINIKQEVVYRLAGDAGKTIDSNPGLF